MSRMLLTIAAAYFALIGAYMVIDPAAWYEATPGVTAAGPYNSHFIRDIGLVFFTSGAALATGALRRSRELAIAGIAWPCLHAVFHIVVWSQRSLPLDTIAAANLFGIQLPAWASLWLSWRLTQRTTGV